MQRRRSREQFEFRFQGEHSGSELVSAIYADPGAFLDDPISFIDGFPKSALNAAYAYFCQPQPDRLTYEVCTSLFKRRHAGLDAFLVQNGYLPERSSRFWFFWRAETLKEASLASVASYLERTWNESSDNTGRFSPLLLPQTGPLTIVSKSELNASYFFRCRVPLPVIPTNGNLANNLYELTIAYDRVGGSFYSINTKIRCADPEHRFRYIESIPPYLKPPDVNSILTSKKPVRALLVLDRHIGDSLSLLSVHYKYLSESNNIVLDIDVSRCGFFRSAFPGWFEALRATRKVRIVKDLASYEGYDLVFDPYDVLPGAFDKKAQEDSGSISLVSSLELAKAWVTQTRRDILDMHLSSVTRMKITDGKRNPGFVRFHLAHESRAAAQQRGRELISLSGKSNAARIVTFFPFGLTADRRYPVQRLVSIMEAIHAKVPDTIFVIAGSDFDTSEAVSVSAGTLNSAAGISNKLRVVVNQSVSKVTELLLASNVIVAMDSGPLHLARAFRLNPIALYTDKVLDPKKMILFPWFVEDNTAEILRPELSDTHVAAELIIQRVVQRLLSTFDLPD